MIMVTTLFVDAKPPPIPLLVTLYSVAKDNEFTLATKEITVGCVRTMAVSQKKVSFLSFFQISQFLLLLYLIFSNCFAVTALIFFLTCL